MKNYRKHIKFIIGLAFVLFGGWIWIETLLSLKWNLRVIATAIRAVAYANVVIVLGVHWVVGAFKKITPLSNPFLPTPKTKVDWFILINILIYFLISGLEQLHSWLEKLNFLN